MFYVKEFYLRCLYFLFGFILIFITVLINKAYIINIIILPFIFFNNKIFDYFIYNNPTEFFYSINFLIFILTLLLMIPYILWSIIDFIKSGLLMYEYTFITKFIITILLILSLIITTFFFFLFPLFWFFFDSWNSFNSGIVKFYLELNFTSYLNYLTNFIIVLSFFVLSFFLMYIFVLHFGINVFYRIKKILIFFNIILATFLSTPEIWVQLLIFIFLNIILESISYCLIFILKLNKVIN